MAIKADGRDLQSDEGLETALLLSLFLDRRAEDDDQLPAEDGDLRGWWGNQFLDRRGDQYGSRIWLLSRAKKLPETARDAELYAREALAWLVDDRVLERFDVVAEVSDEMLALQVTVYRPGRDPVLFKFEHVWAGEAARVR